MKDEIQLNSGNIASNIYLIRGEKVILDFTLAQLYGVEVKILKRAVRRHLGRFPEDFMFELTQEESKSLRYQSGTLEKGRHSKYLPFAFTEQGVAMLSGILNSTNAIQVNISIMRAFVHLRKFLDNHKELAEKIEQLEKVVSWHDEKIQLIFSAIKQLMEEKESPLARNPVGFIIQGK